MLELNQALEFLDEAIIGIENVINQQTAVAQDPISQELARRSFVREFARLGERLTYFRNPDPNKMSSNEINALQKQFSATQSLNAITDNLGKNLV